MCLTSSLDRRLVGPHNRLGQCVTSSLDRRLVGPQNSLASVDKSLRLPGIKTRLLSCKTPNTITVSAELFRIPQSRCGKELFEFQKEIFRIHTV